MRNTNKISLKLGAFLLIASSVFLSGCAEFKCTSPDSFVIDKAFVDENGELIVDEITGALITKSIDLVCCTEEELREFTQHNYPKSFGKITNETQAYKIAIEVASEIYTSHDCRKNESPFEVFYNDTAEAWIVVGTLPKDYHGGVLYVAISGDNGEILMVTHDK